jgi:hypothetical protein
LTDFNHVYSNIGYVMLGGLFMVFTWRRQDPPPELGVLRLFLFDGFQHFRVKICPEYDIFVVVLGKFPSEI